MVNPDEMQDLETDEDDTCVSCEGELVDTTAVERGMCERCYQLQRGLREAASRGFHFGV